MKLKQTLLPLVIAGLVTACIGGKRTTPSEESSSLKAAFGNKFLIGAALNQPQVSGEDTAAIAIAKHHFNSIVAENCMKCEVIHPEENRYNLTPADSLVDFGEENGMAVIGHCLIWHSQLAPWFCVDSAGKNVSPEVLKQRMKEHISTIVGRYKGRIHGWDVVNEAIMETVHTAKPNSMRYWAKSISPMLSNAPHEADPEAELYYNDYGMNVPAARDSVAALVRSLKEKGIRIDAVGMQGHMGMDYPTVEDFEKSLLAFAATGAKVMITEWDMSALPTVSHTANISDTAAYRKALNPYPETLPDSVSRIWNARMKSFFDLFLKHADVITRVTAWGISDRRLMKNDFPQLRRPEYRYCRRITSQIHSYANCCKHLKHNTP